MRTTCTRRSALGIAALAATAFVMAVVAPTASAARFSNITCTANVGGLTFDTVLTFTAEGVRTLPPDVLVVSAPFVMPKGFVPVEGANTVRGRGAQVGTALTLYLESDPGGLAFVVCGGSLTPEQQLNACLSGPSAQVAPCIRAIPGVQACLTQRGFAVLQCLGNVFPQARDCLRRTTLPAKVACMQALFPGLLPRI